MKCPKCDNQYITAHTPWSEMSKPPQDRISSYTCARCDHRFTKEDLNEVPPMPERRDSEDNISKGNEETQGAEANKIAL